MDKELAKREKEELIEELAKKFQAPTDVIRDRLKQMEAEDISGED